MSVFKVIGLSAVLTLSCAFPAGAESLQEAVASALAHHPSVEGARAALDASAADKKAQASGYYPRLNVSGTGGRMYGDNSTSRGLSVTRGAGYSWLWEGGVSARQTIFDGMETISRVGAASANMKAAEMSLQDTRETLAMQVATTYISLHRAREGLKLLRSQQKSVESYLGRIQGLVDEGASDEAELQQARDVRAILDNYTADYEGQVLALEAEYLALTGHVPEGDLVLPAVHPDTLPKTMDDAIMQAKAAHPSIKAANFQTVSADKNIKAEEASLYPDLEGELSYLKTDKDDLIGGEAIDARAVVRLNWDLETGGGQLARIKERRYERMQAQARVKELERAIERTVRQAYSEMHTAKLQLDNQKIRIDLNRKLLDTHNNQFEGAQISLLQLMQSDNQLLLTKLEHQNALDRLVLAQYGILGAMGQLQEAFTVELAQNAPE